MNFVHALAIDMESERERPAEKLRNKEKQNERRHSCRFARNVYGFSTILYVVIQRVGLLALKKGT